MTIARELELEREIQALNIKVRELQHQSTQAEQDRQQLHELLAKKLPISQFDAAMSIVAKPAQIHRAVAHLRQLLTEELQTKVNEIDFREQIGRKAEKQSFENLMQKVETRIRLLVETMIQPLVNGSDNDASKKNLKLFMGQAAENEALKAKMEFLSKRIEELETGGFPMGQENAEAGTIPAAAISSCMHRIEEVHDKVAEAAKKANIVESDMDIIASRIEKVEKIVDPAASQEHDRNIMELLYQNTQTQVCHSLFLSQYFREYSQSVMAALEHHHQDLEKQMTQINDHVINEMKDWKQQVADLRSAWTEVRKHSFNQAEGDTLMVDFNPLFNERTYSVPHSVVKTDKQGNQKYVHAKFNSSTSFRGCNSLGLAMTPSEKAESTQKRFKILDQNIGLLHAAFDRLRVECCKNRKDINFIRGPLDNALRNVREERIAILGELERHQDTNQRILADHRNQLDIVATQQVAEPVQYRPRSAAGAPKVKPSRVGSAPSPSKRRTAGKKHIATGDRRNTELLCHIKGNLKTESTSQRPHSAFERTSRKH